MPDSKKIVLMEDSRTTRKLAADCLRARGYEVLESDEGRYAIELVHKERPELLIADVILPDMHGSEVVRQLRASVELKDLKVLFTTSLLNKCGKAPGEESVLAIDGEEMPAVGKPYSKELLIEIVDRIVGGPN